MAEQLEARVALLESEVALLKSKLEENLSSEQPSQPWWEKISGKFANDPMYDVAMRLGKDYRDSQPLNDISSSES